MVLPTFTPARCIFPAVGLLPVQEKRCITDGNRKFNFTGQIGAGIQSCVATGNIETRTSFNHQGDFITTKCEAQAHTRVGVVAHIHAIGFPALTVIH